MQSICKSSAARLSKTSSLSKLCPSELNREIPDIVLAHNSCTLHKQHQIWNFPSPVRTFLVCTSSNFYRLCLPQQNKERPHIGLACRPCSQRKRHLNPLLHSVCRKSDIQVRTQWQEHIACPPMNCRHSIRTHSFCKMSM